MTFHSSQHISPPQLPLIIIGAGYTGLRMYQQALENGWLVFATSRQPHIHLSHIPHKNRLRFDLAHLETWGNIPQNAHLVWCFPATPLEKVKDFFLTRARQSGRILVMGSTSAYLPESLTISEGTSLKMDLPRVQAEEYLRTNYGAIIIRLAGLYGPGRNVCDWIRKGKIKNTKKWVNLLHVEDAAAICLTALEKATEGSTYLASDGHPRTWNEICLGASTTWQVPIPALTLSQLPGKQVSICKLQADLQYIFRFPDLFQALDLIEKSPT